MLPALLLCAGALCAAPPKAPEAVKDKTIAVEMARTRGKLIFLTVIVDHDHENRAVIENVFRDKEFLKLASEFVIVYANPEDQHGKVMVKGEGGKKEARCADCPSIVCTDHIALAQHFARGFFPDSDAKTPMHFVIDAELNVLATISNGDERGGYHHVPAKEVITHLKAALDRHGRGLSEKEYEGMLRNLSDAKAARARENFPLELQKLAPVLALEREVDGVREARARMQEIDGRASTELEKVEALEGAGSWEEALEELQRIERTYPGTLAAGRAEKREKELLGRVEVKRLLLARDLYERGMNFRQNTKLELARKKFEECIRRCEGTKYAALSAEELKTLPE